MRRPNPPQTDSYSLPALDPRDAPAMALLGHDLRAALSEAIGGLRLIDPTPLPATARAQIARSKAASEALALLLEQALALLLGESAPGDGMAAPLQTERLLESIRLRWQPRARENGLEFILTAAADLPPMLAIDAALIERVLSNLLGNAIKYAGRGLVHCHFAHHPDNHLQITVQDEGPGFPNAALPRLFATYNRPENATRPGTGLGLHIVHEMVQHAGGLILAQNRSTGGAEITVQLPMPASDASKTQTTDSTQPDLSRLRVLVADDNEMSRQILARMLAEMGAEVVKVSDGVQAVGRIERESFDLVVLDIEMPRFNGLDVIRHIRAMPGEIAALPILAVTAYRLRANKEAIEAAGANAILSKPVLCPKTLAASVAAAMSLPTLPVQEQPQQLDANHFDQLLKMAGPVVGAELIDRLHEDLRDAERAILSAAHGPDWLAIRAQTHVLMALAGTAGAPRLQHLAEELNAVAHSPIPDRGTFLTLLPQLLESLDTLIHFVGRQSPGPAPDLAPDLASSPGARP